MNERNTGKELPLDQLDQVNGGNVILGRYEPGQYVEAAKDFFRQCVGNEVYDRAVHTQAGHRHHYVAARVFLNQQDWERFCWIEKYGSLEGYPG